MENDMTGATPQTDKHVKVPKAVQAAADRANEAHNQVYTKEPDGKAPEVESAKPPEKAAEPPTPKAETPPAENFEHKYNSLKGRFDSQAAQMRTLQMEVDRIKRMPPPPPPKAPTTAPLLTPQEEQDYGSDFLAVVGKKAKAEVLPEIESLKQKLAEVDAKLRQVNTEVVTSAQDKMLQQLDRELSNWRDINYNDRFLEYLSLPDAYSGVIRHELLKQAYSRNDAARVLAFFKGFLAEEAALAPPVSKPDPITPEVKKVPLESLAAPGRAKSSAASAAPVEKPVINRAQINNFYAEVRAGKYRANPQEKNRLEAMIFEAEREGRIVP